jgi:hypothetical protein
VFASVAENIVFFAVPMQIQTKLYLPPLTICNQLFFDFKQMRMKDTRRLLPPAIQIDSTHIASKVTVYDSVNIDHRKYFHYIIFQNVVALWSVFE